MEEAEMIYTEYLVECVIDEIFAHNIDLEVYFCEELEEGESGNVAE